MSFQLQLIHSPTTNQTSRMSIPLKAKLLITQPSPMACRMKLLCKVGPAFTSPLETIRSLTFFIPLARQLRASPVFGYQPFNAMGVKANGIGNHEMDGNIGEFIDMVNASDYVHLSANLDFSSVVDTDGNAAPFVSYAAGEPAQSVEELAGKIAPSAYVEIDGEQIGLIGRSPSEMFSLVADGNLPGLDYVGGTSGEGTAREPLLEPLPLIQAEIDRLTNQGINKIIFIDHAQDYTDQSVLPAELDGVDVIFRPA